LAIFRALPIVIAMLVSFALTIAYEYWQHRTDSMVSMAPIAPPADERPTAPPRYSALAGNDGRPTAHMRTMAPRIPVDAQPSAAAISAPPSNDDGPMLPVIFSIVSRDVYGAEETPDGSMQNVTNKVTEVLLVNSSDQRLNITATEVDSDHGISQAQISIAEGAQRRIGVNQGLKMASGAEITLRSNPYRDLKQQVP
jgi:hypothetical protein